MKQPSIFTLLFLVILTPFFPTCKIEAPPLLCTIAQPANLPKGVPAYSDVCLSSRWERPRNPQDTFDTFRAAEDFHATSLHWVYTTNPTFIKKAKDLGYQFQVALSPVLTDLPFESRQLQKGRIEKPSGEKATVPWMLTGKGWWGCVNHPDFRASYLAHIKMVIEAGADGFQVDDPAFSYMLLRNEWEEVCYCDYCQQIADSLKTSPSAIQEASVLAFHKEMKQAAETIAGRPVPFSSNNFRGDWELFPHSFFDFGLAEAPLHRGNPEYIYASLREARQRGKGQTFSFVSGRTWLIQKVIASTYASGGNLLVPWDVWQGGGKPRYFGKPEEIAPLYAFVRANEQWLNGYEDAFYTNTQLDTRYLKQEQIPLYFEEYRRNMHAYIRAKPNQPDAPIVVHLVDWEIPTVDSVKIYLNEAFFFEAGIDTFELLTPIDFDKMAHTNASKTKNYQNLRSSKPLPFYTDENGATVIIVPKLKWHWGMLIIKKKAK